VSPSGRGVALREIEAALTGACGVSTTVRPFAVNIEKSSRKRRIRTCAGPARPGSMVTVAIASVE
jgi:hypothetical protein